MSEENRYAILIGSSRFPEEPGDKLPPLRCPENDVDGLEALLRSETHGGYREVVPLKNEPHHGVLKTINLTLKRAAKDDLVLIYYSGHGKLDLAGRLYLATPDTVTEALEATSIPVQSIVDYIRLSSCKRVVLILDCCYSGAVGDSILRANVDEQLQLASSSRGIYVLTASTAVQVAEEKERDKNGLLTKHIIQGIQTGEADSAADGEISMEEIYRYVHRKVTEEGFQEPMKWDLNVVGELIIARSGRSSRAERGKQVREMMLGHKKGNFISNRLLMEALDVLKLKPDQLHGEVRHRDELLQQLFEGRLVLGDFIDEWNAVVADIKPPAVGTPGPPSVLAPAKREPDTPPAAPERPLHKKHAAKEDKPDELPPRSQAWWRQYILLIGLLMLLLAAPLTWWIKQPSPTPPGASLPSKTAPNPETPPPVEARINPKDGQPYVPIPPGEFQMGCSPGDECGADEKPPHNVKITRRFWMGQTEVTQAAYERVMGGNPSRFKGPQRPVEQVTWDETRKYCEAVGGRLPTEAEWEYAARAGSQQARYGELDKIAWYSSNSRGETQPVGRKQANSWGLYDMLGNTWEWVADWYQEDYYRTLSSPAIDPKGPPSGKLRVVRGGSWDYFSRVARASIRVRYVPEIRDLSVGFRCVREVIP